MDSGAEFGISKAFMSSGKSFKRFWFYLVGPIIKIAKLDFRGNFIWANFKAFVFTIAEIFRDISQRLIKIFELVKLQATFTQNFT